MIKKSIKLLIITFILSLNLQISYASEIEYNNIDVETQRLISEDIIKLYDLIKGKVNSINAEENKISAYETGQVNNEISNIDTTYYSRTLEKMKEYDYFNESVTGISESKLDDIILNENLKSYGKLIYKGMPTEEYRKTMVYEWEDVTDYSGMPEPIDIDLLKVMTYEDYVEILKKLSRYDGVFVYKIGKSHEGRDLYCIEIDVQSDSDKEVFMMAGQIHSREFAGGVYILKQFADLIQKAQWDANTMELLKQNKYVAVPIVSTDVREAIIQNPISWTVGNQLWKSYADGTDGNRNYPGLQWGLVAKGNNQKQYITFNPGYAYFAGIYGGSSNETKSMMKWFYHYIVVEKAIFYLDYHQQGRVIYAGEHWQTKEQFEIQMQFVRDLQSVIRTKSGNTYNYAPEEKAYGLQGEGSASTDYAISLAVGAKFSPAYGFHVFPHWGKEYTLMEIKDLDNKWVTTKETNPKFVAVTLEIGGDRSYLGYGNEARQLIADEYYSYNFDKLLEKLPTFIK